MVASATNKPLIVLNFKGHCSSSFRGNDNVFCIHPENIVHTNLRINRIDPFFDDRADQCVVTRDHVLLSHWWFLNNRVRYVCDGDSSKVYPCVVDVNSIDAGSFYVLEVKKDASVDLKDVLLNAVVNDVEYFRCGRCNPNVVYSDPSSSNFKGVIDLLLDEFRYYTGMLIRLDAPNCSLFLNRIFGLFVDSYASKRVPSGYLKKYGIADPYTFVDVSPVKDYDPFLAPDFRSFVTYSPLEGSLFSGTPGAVFIGKCSPIYPVLFCLAMITYIDLILTNVFLYYRFRFVDRSMGHFRNRLNRYDIPSDFTVFPMICPISSATFVINFHILFPFIGYQSPLTFPILFINEDENADTYEWIYWIQHATATVNLKSSLINFLDLLAYRGNSGVNIRFSPMHFIDKQTGDVFVSYDPGRGDDPGYLNVSTLVIDRSDPKSRSGYSRFHIFKMPLVPTRYVEFDSVVRRVPSSADLVHEHRDLFKVEPFISCSSTPTPRRARLSPCLSEEIGCYFDSGEVYIPDDLYAALSQEAESTVEAAYYDE